MGLPILGMVCAIGEVAIFWSLYYLVGWESAVTYMLFQIFYGFYWLREHQKS